MGLSPAQCEENFTESQIEKQGVMPTSLSATKGTPKVVTSDS